MDLLKLETIALWIAIVIYSLITVVAIFAAVLRKRPERSMLAMIALALVSHTTAIGARWMRIDHLPVGNGFEMLSANVWGLMLALLFGYWRLPKVRVFAAVLMPVVIMLMAWMMLIPVKESSLPPTYDTVWLVIHIGFIKLFMGCAFVALGISGIVLLRAAGLGHKRLAHLQPDAALDKSAYRCMALALIFDTLGIVAGAIWAQDAWGHYWSWDKLEVWSLVTWLAVGLTLHVRATFRTRPTTNAMLVLATWLIAFFTFFGIPFVTTALHKGMV